MEEINEKDFKIDANAPKIDNNVYRTFETVCLNNSEEWEKWQKHPLTKSLFKQLEDYSKYVDTHKAFPRILLRLNSATGKRVIMNFFVRKPQIDDFIEYGLIKATDVNGNEITKKSNLTKDDNEFYLTFDNPYFYEGEYISAGYGSNCIFRVTNNPLLKNGRYTYKVERTSKNDYPVFYYDLTPGSGFKIEKYIFETDL